MFCKKLNRALKFLMFVCIALSQCAVGGENRNQRITISNNWDADTYNGLDYTENCADPIIMLKNPEGRCHLDMMKENIGRWSKKVRKNKGAQAVNTKANLIKSQKAHDEMQDERTKGELTEELDLSDDAISGLKWYCKKLRKVTGSGASRALIDHADFMSAILEKIEARKRFL